MSVTRVGGRVPGYVEAASSVYTWAESATNGTTWTTLVASTASPVYIVDVQYEVRSDNSSGSQRTVYLGIGAASSEVTIWTGQNVDIWLYDGGIGYFANANDIWPLRYPILVPAGTRIAMKLDATRSGSYFGIHYVAESVVR